MSELPVFYQIIIYAIPILLAIILHEIGHGFVAMVLGDPTAKEAGRLSLNPFKHMDPVGSVVVPVAMFFLSGFVFGWAKPVPVNWNRLKHKKRDMALVAVAGPISNLIMLIAWFIFAKLCVAFLQPDQIITKGLILMAWVGIIINFIIMVFNLLPLPPLDGSRIVFAALPDSLARQYARVEPYGLVIMMVLLYFAMTNNLITPLLSQFERFMSGLIF